MFTENSSTGELRFRSLRLMDYLGIFFGITTVVGFVLAYYWHAQSVQERAPSYLVSPTRARIVDTSIRVPPQLRVLYRGADLNSNVSAAVVYFWNDGKLPIKSEDVLDPLRIELEPGCEILDARILKLSRSLTNLTKGEISDTTKNVLPLSFRILEQGDGAVLQIIYSGKPEARLSVMGDVVGAGPPKELFNQPRLTINHRQSLIRVFAVLSTIVMAILIMSFLLFTWVHRKMLGLDGLQGLRRSAWVVGFVLAQIVFFGVFMYLEHRMSQPVVPSTIWMTQ